MHVTSDPFRDPTDTVPDAVTVPVLEPRDGSDGTTRIAGPHCEMLYCDATAGPHVEDDVSHVPLTSDATQSTRGTRAHTGQHTHLRGRKRSRQTHERGPCGAHFGPAKPPVDGTGAGTSLWQLPSTQVRVMSHTATTSGFRGTEFEPRRCW